MNTLSFTKMHGLGNDFMIVDATVEPFALSCRQIQDCADRHRGVGFDQLLVVAPPANQQTDFTYLIYNSDGSSAQQCGNGARCLAKFIHAHGLSTKKALSLQTADKITRVFIEDDGTVTVEMAEPYFTPEQIPFIDPGSGEPYYFEIGGQKHHFHIAGVGNPHAVILTESLDPAVVASVGGQLSVHTNFPEGANVGFMQIISPNQVHLQVYERGAGPTLACGSGACAAVAVGRRLGLLAKEVQVRQPGGELSITWEGAGSPIFMRGPAQFVYEGRLFLTAS